MPSRESAGIVIVGGGVIGLGVAWHLAGLGRNDVLLVDRNRLTSGTSWHAAGIVGPLRASMNATRLAMAANEVFPALERETGQGTGYRRTGGFWLARTEDRLVELRRIAAVGEMAGLDARIVGRDEVAAAAPNLRVDDLAGALWVAEDGQANPVDVCMAYARGARAAGVRIREGVACTGIERRNGAVHAVRLSDGTAVRCETVVNCAGAWARAVGAMAGVPVTRIEEHAFRIVSGAATRARDLAWIERQRRRAGLAAEAFDATSSEVVLGIAGPRSRELLGALTPADLSNEAWPFAASRRIELAAASIRMTRLGFTGELGFELCIPVENAPAVYEAIAGAGQALGLVHCGHLALDACRLEKGHRHWGHDVGPHDTPLEAGLGFAVAWDKPGGFIGRDALLVQRRKGIRRRLLQFAVADAHPLLLHDEPVYRHGTLAGHTTSGGRGFRTGLSLCFAYVSCEPGTPRSELLGGGYEIGIAGERFPLRALARPAYDPHRARLRG